MSVIAIVGRTGSGKTLFLTKIGLASLKRSQEVYSNYGLAGSYHLPFNLLGGVYGSVVLIDEAGVWFNARKWQNFPEEIGLLLKQNRKLLGDVSLGSSAGFFYTAQSFTDVDKNLRSITDWVYTCFKFPFLRLFAYRRFRPADFDDIGMVKQKAHSWGFGLYFGRKRYFRAYDTFALVERSPELRSLREELLASRALVLEQPTIPRKRWFRVFPSALYALRNYLMRAER